MSSIGPIKRGEYLEVRVWAQDQAKQEKKIYVILKCEDKDEENNYYIASSINICNLYDFSSRHGAN